MIGRIAEDKLFFDTKEDLIEEMEYHGIEKALVYSSIAYQYNPEYGNKLLKKETGNNKRILPVAVAVPWDNIDKCLSEEMEDFIRKSACGVRFFPKKSNFKFSKFNISEVLDFVNKIRLPVFIDYGEIEDFEDFNAVVYSYPDIPFIITRPGYRLGRILCSLFGLFKNVHIDISNFHNYEGIEYIGRKYGYNRFLFGSGWPYMSPGGPISRIVYAGISGSDKEKIAYYNLEEIVKRITR
jgi:predicted TIM-barrel fold metal-dependent hydrolase